MAKLIPAAIRQDSSRGERELFFRLREDPLAKDWTIFHSLDVKKHINQIEGEIDLVILIPDMGILCLEVKACDVSRKEGVWVYHYQPKKTSTKGPFKQASDAMHSLRAWLKNKDASLSGILFFSAVVFTEINFKSNSPEWHDWQYLNRSDILSGSISQKLSAILAKAHKLIQEKHSWYNSGTSRPSLKQIEKITDLIRGDFSFFVDENSNVSRAVEELDRLTEEQVTISAQYPENNRILVKGPAGTGKTYLAIDAANWAVNGDKSTAFFCFNNLLGSWIESRMHDLSNGATRRGINFYAGTFHKYLFKFLSHDERQYAGRRNFFNLELPRIVLDRLLEKSTEPIFQYLVVDEAQDLISPVYLDIMDLLLEGGLSAGNWIMLGDFEKQAIFSEGLNSTGSIDLAQLKKYSDFATFSLRINCRNLKNISDTVTLASALNPGYKSNLHVDIQGEVNPYFYGSKLAQKELLKNALLSLSSKFKLNEIVVLSMKSIEDSISHIASEDSSLNLRQFNFLSNDQNQIAFSTVRLFKGLEAQAVVLTDVDDLDRDISKALLYVGMSRAKISLTMLMSESIKGSYQKLILEGLRRVS